MVDEEIILDTIRKMKESGLEEFIIISTLQDIGLSEEQAKDYIARVAGRAKPAPPKPAPAPAAQAPWQAPAYQPVQAPQPIPLQPIPWALEPAPPQPTPQQPIPWALEPAPGQAIPAAPAAAWPAQSQQPVENVSDFLSEAMNGVPPTPAPVQQGFGAAPRRLQKAPAAAFQAWAPAQQMPAQAVQQDLAARAEEDAMRHAATQAMISQQAQALGQVQKSVQKIDQLQKSIKKIEDKPIQLPKGASADTKAILVALELLRKDLEETKALAGATRTLMEKILEVNRKILGRLP